ncbi:hypothetical protein OF83DRAFT_1289364 [Amylostereum chailletii]|nr:hypothetical protein OF83DRAFT_1289364 [Amylostereum chailletii]
MSFPSPFARRSARLVEDPRGQQSTTQSSSHLEQTAHTLPLSARTTSRNVEPSLFFNRPPNLGQNSQKDDSGWYHKDTPQPHGHVPRALAPNRNFFPSALANKEDEAHISTIYAHDSSSEGRSTSVTVRKELTARPRERHGQLTNVSIPWESQKVVFKREQSQENLNSSFSNPSFRKNARELSSTGGNGIEREITSESRGDPLAVMLEERLASLQSVKHEAEEQRRENIQLTSELTVLRDENAELLRRLNDLRVNTRKALDVKSKSLVEVQNALSSLKAQSRESFTLVKQARGAMPDVEDLRRIVAESTSRLEVLLDGNGNITKLSEAREVVNDLQLECATTRQANDLLRDKLTDFSSQLAEARDRIRELEAGRDRETHALNISLRDLSNSNAVANDHAENLRKSQADLSDALVACARFEEEVSRLEERVLSLNGELRDKTGSLKELHVLRHENIELRALLKSRDDGAVVELHSMKNEILASMSQSSSAHDLATIEQLASRCAGLEAELDLHKKAVPAHNKEMKEAANREQVTLLLNQQLTAEKRNNDERIKAHELEARDQKEELRGVKDKLQQAELHCQVLQERFDNQSTTLKLAREAHGDAHERLLAAEKSFTSKLEVETAKRQQEIVVLTDRNAFLQSSLEDAKKELKQQQNLHVKAQGDYENRLKAERDSIQIHVLAAQEKQLQAEYARSRAVEDAEAARTATSTVQDTLDGVKAELHEASLLSASLQSNIDRLQNQVGKLQAENTSLLDQQSTLDARYRTNELTDGEKSFVDGLLAESQSFFDKKLADKQNEVRRKVAIISSLESKMTTLEKSLARYLKNDQAAKKAVITDEQTNFNMGNLAPSSSDTSIGKRRQNVLKLGDTPPARSVVDGPSGGRKTMARVPIIDNFRTLRPEGQQAGNTTFTALGESEHDDILQFDDPCKPNSPYSLGKRSRTPSQTKGEESSDIGRPRTRQVGLGLTTALRNVRENEHLIYRSPITRRLLPGMPKDGSRSRSRSRQLVNALDEALIELVVRLHRLALPAQQNPALAAPAPPPVSHQQDRSGSTAK